MWCGHQVKETDRNLFTQDAPIRGLCSISHGNYYLRVAIIAVYFLHVRAYPNVSRQRWTPWLAMERVAGLKAYETPDFLQGHVQINIACANNGDCST